MPFRRRRRSFRRRSFRRPFGRRSSRLLSYSVARSRRRRSKFRAIRRGTAMVNNLTRQIMPEKAFVKLQSWTFYSLSVPAQNSVGQAFLPNSFTGWAYYTPAREAANYPTALPIYNRLYDHCYIYASTLKSFWSSRTTGGSAGAWQRGVLPHDPSSSSGYDLTNSEIQDFFQDPDKSFAPARMGMEGSSGRSGNSGPNKVMVTTWRTPMFNPGVAWDGPFTPAIIKSNSIELDEGGKYPYPPEIEDVHVHAYRNDNASTAQTWHVYFKITWYCMFFGVRRSPVKLDSWDEEHTDPPAPPGPADAAEAAAAEDYPLPDEVPLPDEDDSWEDMPEFIARASAQSRPHDAAAAQED